MAYQVQEVNKNIFLGLKIDKILIRKCDLLELISGPGFKRN